MTGFEFGFGGLPVSQVAEPAVARDRRYGGGLPPERRKTETPMEVNTI